MDDVVMVGLLTRQGIAQLEPHFVQQVDLLGGQTRGVRAQIKDLFLARGSEDF